MSLSLSSKILPTSDSRRATKSASTNRKQDTALELWVVLARAFGAISAQSAEDVAKHGLTSTEFAILEVLYHKGPLLLGEVQRKILVTSGGITYLVDRLVEKGFVKREECPEDRRARYAVLTAAGGSADAGEEE